MSLGSPVAKWLSSTALFTAVLYHVSLPSPSQAFDLGRDSQAITSYPVPDKAVSPTSRPEPQGLAVNLVTSESNVASDTRESNVAIVDGAFDDLSNDLTLYVLLLKGAKFLHETEEWLAYATDLNILAPLPTLAELKSVVRVTDTYDVLYAEKFAMGQAVRHSGSSMVHLPQKSESVRLSSAKSQPVRRDTPHVDRDPEYLIHTKGDGFQTVSNVGPMPEKSTDGQVVPFTSAAVASVHEGPSVVLGVSLSIISLVVLHFIIKQVVLDH